MDNLLMISLVLLTINFAHSTELTCERDVIAHFCESSLQTNNTICSENSFRNFCPCTCDTHDRLGQNPVSDPDPLANCPERYVDEENRCQYRLTSDPTMCSLTGALIYCPCTCGETSNYPENPDPVGNDQNQGQGQNQNPHDDQNQILVNPNLCADVPDSKMEYDCQYRIAQDRQLCDDPSYRGMCRCTCVRFGNAAAIQENTSDSPPVPNSVPPISPLDYENGPERCVDYEAQDGGRSCFMQVARITACSDELRVDCPCTCRLQDEGDLCPDSPWTPMAAICQMRFSEGRCHELRVREECPCTCAFVFVQNTDTETPSATPSPGSHNNHAPDACIDTGLPTLCNYVVTHNMCASQYHFCKRTCNRCSDESLPDSNEPVVNLMPDVDHENERGSNENSTEESEENLPDDGLQEEPCFDSIYSGLCATYDMLGRCAYWWPYCRLTCEVCTFNPYLNPGTSIATPDYSLWDLSGSERCTRCQQYFENGACNAIDLDIKSYCQTHCGSCVHEESEEEILIETFEEQGNNGNVPTNGLDSEDPTGDEEDEEQGVPIDGENVVHDNALPEICVTGSDADPSCPSWYRQGQCRTNPTVSDLCPWSCNRCPILIQVVAHRQQLQQRLQAGDSHGDEEPEELEITV